ncbi:sensor histidine kinase [Bacillus sp. S/N-304-OC-R1]|uniref:sensor histidine kinase n=1 Tax=Bacillus sp. S/N-304-OC-R1 TaxID=2758034 RepID=UPI001C8DA1D2|nr:sensor histidine kinase [Bacillus sp. S/N-304-OC-R1]MBY0123035.1 sensor histidine kinase [Bacillus sp. S/N-304-OC-R1]
MLSSHSVSLKNTRNEWFALILTAVLTAIASEIKMIPFNGEAFRFGLGSISFFLLILIRPPASMIRTGFVTGVVVICFRITEDILFYSAAFGTSLINHIPAFTFYFLYAAGLHFVKIDQYKTSPLLLGAIAAGMEFTGNSIEHLLRYLLLSHENVGLRDWALVCAVALFRSFFAVGLYSSITVSEQKKRMQEMLNIGSELYAESLYLQKSMDQIEQITASSHELYRKLKKEDLQELSSQALLIAQEIHEVKKDSQRILSGLSKVSIQKINNVVLLSDVLDIVLIGNEKYSELLNKEITFPCTMTVDYETNQQIPLLALLNNLMANSVEAIVKNGEVSIAISEELEFTTFMIKDTGKGIHDDDLSYIFEPGFTTKYNHEGVASTGIGLSHVKSIIETLEGKIDVTSSLEGTAFLIQIPTNNIRKRGE